QVTITVVDAPPPDNPPPDNPPPDNPPPDNPPPDNPPPDNPPPPGDGSEPLEGFGSSTRGGEGGRVIRVSEPTEQAVRTAFTAPKSGPAFIRFETTEPIPITQHLPRLEGDFVTVEGNGATLYAVGGYVNLIEVDGHDVIVRDIRVRNGYDNLR